MYDFPSLKGMLGRGIINWGEPVQDVLDDGALLINQVRLKNFHSNFLDSN